MFVKLLPTVALGLAATAALSVPSADPDKPAPVDFNRDIRPILAEKCLLCHGPDERDRAADLRLDLRESAFEDRGGYAAIVPGEPGESELFLRVSDDFDPMPPEDFDAPLTAEEVALFERWIAEGANWEEHWAYTKPGRAAPPAVGDEAWLRDPLDRYVLAGLEAAGLEPSPEAEPEALLRRLSLDLTGLPPTPAEVDAFLADDAPGAYERQVDRLLDSPRYGEHMARYWLDAARYGDTHGFHLDNVRSLWRWREWVIEAFNANQPFDRFTVEQLAGDLLPDPTLDQLIATGFNRCNPTTGEGGLIAEEYLVKYAVDRVETTSTVFLGTTMGCAACHDHKYDPFSQREFYELFGFFHSFDEQASDQNALAPPPAIAAPTREQQAELARLDEALTEAEAAMLAPMPELDAAQPAWEAAWAADLAERWHPLEPLAASATSGATLTRLDDGSLLASGTEPDTDVYEILAQTDAEVVSAVHLEALTHGSFVNGGIGRSSNANFVLSGIEVAAVERGRSADFRHLELASAFADYAQPNYPVAGALDPDPKTGWGVHKNETEDHHATFVLAEPLRSEGGALLRLRLRFESPHAKHIIGRLRLSVSTRDVGALDLGTWHSVGPFFAKTADEAFATDYGPEAVPLDLAAVVGTDARWRERPEWIDGQEHLFEGANAAMYAARRITAPTARRLRLALGSDDALKVWLNGELQHENNTRRPLAPGQDRVDLELPPGENQLLLKVVNAGGGFGFHFEVELEDAFNVPLDMARAVSLAATERDEADVALLRGAYRREAWPEYGAHEERLAALRSERAAVEAEVPRTMITRDRETPRPTHVLIRGQYDQKGAEVQPGVPAILPPLAPAEPERGANRLDLARWLVDPDHPLTARVTVNRFWQQVFGIGLVETAEDFGTRGAWPSHPELLDALALDFVEGGWDVKGLMRRLVTSATYRQSARVTPDRLALDPENRLLSRGPRQRLDAETLRDTALFVSGLLVERIGGPSVKPYQPGGLWKAVGYTSSNTANFVQDSGDKLYRRSLYTFWKRTSPPPTMAILDAPTRETCTVQRARTNTPLQALALMNDVQFVEAARAFAERILREGGSTEDERLVFAFRSVTARRPAAAELDVLRSTLAGHRDTYAADAEAARALVEVGDSTPDAAADPAQLAAWTLLANLLFNLDEAVTRS